MFKIVRASCSSCADRDVARRAPAVREMSEREFDELENRVLQQAAAARANPAADAPPAADPLARQRYGSCVSPMPVLGLVSRDAPSAS